MNFSYNPQKLDFLYNHNSDLQLINELNRGSAQEQMRFQKMMSDTSHQREVADLQRAGLNPALSLNNGASTPAGSYSNVDTSLMSARMQNRIQQKQIDSQMKMNDKSLDNAYKIAQMQSEMAAKVQAYNTDKMYELGLQQSKMSYEAQLLGFTNAFDIQKFLQENENTRFYYGFDNPKTTDEVKAWIYRNSGAMDSAKNAMALASGVTSDLISGLGSNSSGLGVWNKVKDWVKGQVDETKAIKQSNLEKREYDKTMKNADRAIRKANGYLELMPKNRSNGSFNYNIGYNPNKHDKNRRTSSAK